VATVATPVSVEITPVEVLKLIPASSPGEIEYEVTFPMNATLVL